jgi:hypothetical protein
MSEEPKVYLDHHIKRENLRYRRPEGMIGHSGKELPNLRLIDLMRDDFMYLASLRKPDFQRATWAWTPEDCVSLLESVVNRQVVPSIIMWKSPDGLEYILDGGHRISAILAWLKDDWGEEAADNFEDPDEAEAIRRTAHEVRNLVKARVGLVSEYQDADRQIQTLTREGKAPKDHLAERSFKRGLFYQSLRMGEIWFDVLWVHGDYGIAEQSFLKINKSGKRLSDWETKLIENRNSSFARVIMSISNPESVPYYWPDEIPDGLDQPLLDQKRKAIIEDARRLQVVWFEPKFQRPPRSLTQPLMVAPGEKKPYYVAELLTVLEGFRGQLSETEKLLQRDSNATPREILENGHRLTSRAVELFEHLVGSSPKSLEVVPALYFYTPAGLHIRSLLYGFIYWLLGGNDDEILTRKTIFSAYRGAFEEVLIEKKEEVISTIGRKAGSGPEVTWRTAKFFQELMKLLETLHGETQSKKFKDDFAKFESLSGKSSRTAPVGNEVASRTFSAKQKAEKILQSFLENAVRCEICGGLLDPGRSVQHDHITPWSEGGRTSSENQRLTHPFCNNQRAVIENYRNGLAKIVLPPFAAVEDPTKPKQLDFFDILSAI